jgi:transcriptional regulator with XRE-family HTH domain
MAIKGPATTRRRLRGELRRMREDAGFGQAEVVKKLDWSLSKLIRIENGSVGVSVTDARALLSLYGAPVEVRGDLIDLARSSRERRWWSHYRDVLAPQYQEFVGFEADATCLRQFHPTMVPGLLQTEAYMRAIFAALALSPLSTSQSQSLIEVRRRRQAEVLGGQHPPEYVVVIDEGALRRPVGGVDAMRGQLRYLVDAQLAGTASVGVLPFSAGPHVGMSGAFHLMEFDDDADDDILYLENAPGEMVQRDNPELVLRYRERFADLVAMSWWEAAAVNILLEIAEELV